MTNPQGGGLYAYKVALIFTGHMTDLPDRPTPRFPPTSEARARVAIRAHLKSRLPGRGGSLIGIASAARGGDLLFLEACRSLGLPAYVVLPFPPETFVKTSVAGTPGDWPTRFWKLWRSLPDNRREVLASAGDDPYDACNRRMLEIASGLAQTIRLLALADGGDRAMKPGGTASFVALVKREGGRVCRIDTRAFLPRS